VFDFEVWPMAVVLFEVCLRRRCIECVGGMVNRATGCCSLSFVTSSCSG
jgi:hypothetical protein